VLEAASLTIQTPNASIYCACAARYKREPGLFEWFYGHNALRRIIRTYFSKKRPVLHVGCGTSNLQEGMAKSGYNVVNVRFAGVAVV
jgi:2-polyprenyl-3-methyl-5-hydroxy-6-metoxy-1,4-benzoquinol methylase